MKQSLRVTIEHLDANGHYDEDDRVVLTGSAIIEGAALKGHLRILGATGRKVALINIVVEGHVDLNDEWAEISFNTLIPMEGDIYSSPVPVPLYYRNIVCYANERGEQRSLSLPQHYAGMLKKTADGIYMGTVDRSLSEVATSKAEIQLTL